MSAQALYEELTSARTAALETAREAARLTIPSLIPPEGHNSNLRLPSPYQSLGAFGVNNLASKLMIALYPQGTSFFRYIIPEQISAQSEVPAEQREEIAKALSAVENRALQEFEAGPIRPQKSEVMMHLVVAGNVLTYFPDEETYRVFRLDQYVVRRDAAGRPLDAVVHEMVSPRGLDDDVKAACGVKADDKENVHVYTQVRWDPTECSWHQEINGKRVPGSEGSSPPDLSPWTALRWKAIPESSYGRGHCEEYLGDLISLEGLSQAIVEFSAVAAKIVLLIDPNSNTDIADINKARSGDAVVGNLKDVGILTLEKYADFQVAEKVAAKLEERLSRAFLLRSGLVRDAERVTAEEIRATAQELEDTQGGVYTVLAREEQAPFTRRFLHVLTKGQKIPRIPPGAATPTVVTGFQALGRNHSLNKLRGFIQDLANMLGPEAAMAVLRPSDVATRLATGWGVEGIQALVKSAEELQAEQEAAQQRETAQALIDKAAAPMVQGMMKPE